MKSLAVGAAAIVAASVLALPGSDDAVPEDAARPAAPTVLPPSSGQPVLPDDGLVHLIVTPTGVTSSDARPEPAPAPATEEPTDAVGSGAVGATDGESAWTIDGGEGELVLVDGELMRRGDDGTLTPAADVEASESTTAAPDPTPASPVASFGHPTIDQLAVRDGVESVTALGDGSFAVAVADTSAIDDLPIDAVADTPLALFADPYESYQWALENTGDNLRGVSGAPAQREDADIDVTTAWGSATGAGVVVAVIDSGVDFSHP